MQPTKLAKELAHEWAKRYAEDRPAMKLPGTIRTISDTAINDWADDEAPPTSADLSLFGEPLQQSVGARDTSINADRRAHARRRYIHLGWG